MRRCHAHAHPPSSPGTPEKKNRQFLVKPAGTCYCFSERPIGRRATHDFGVRSSERLGNGAASHWNRWKRTRKWRRLNEGGDVGRRSIRLPIINPGSIVCPFDSELS